MLLHVAHSSSCAALGAVIKNVSIIAYKPTYHICAPIYELFLPFKRSSQQNSASKYREKPLLKRSKNLKKAN